MSVLLDRAPRTDRLVHSKRPLRASLAAAAVVAASGAGVAAAPVLATSASTGGYRFERSPIVVIDKSGGDTQLFIGARLNKGLPAPGEPPLAREFNVATSDGKHTANGEAPAQRIGLKSDHCYFDNNNDVPSRLRSAKVGTRVLVEAHSGQSVSIKTHVRIRYARNITQSRMADLLGCRSGSR